MPIKVKIIPTEEEESSGAIKIKIVADPPEEPEPVTVEMNARRALNGDIMIFDHDLIDIVVSPSKSSIVTFPKRLVEREAYPTQDRFYAFLTKKGVIKMDSIQGGSIYSSLEAKIHESSLEGINSIQTALFITSLFMEDERPDIMARKHMKKDMTIHIHDPGEDQSTELGYVPHSDRKGSFDSRVRPYGYQYMYSVLREREEK